MQISFAYQFSAQIYKVCFDVLVGKREEERREGGEEGKRGGGEEGRRGGREEGRRGGGEDSGQRGGT